MAEFLGNNAYIQWVWSGGTVLVHGDYRTLDWNPNKDLIEGSAGSDAAQHNVVGIERATASLGLVAQTGGTALVAAMAYGNIGTLTWGVEGTVSGKPKVILPAMSLGAKVKSPYQGLVEITVDFNQEGGAYTEGSW